MPDIDTLIAPIADLLTARSPGQDEFHQAVLHVARDTIAIEKAHPPYAAAKVTERLTEPDRMIAFRVVWQDDQGAIQVNRGWRVQYCNAIGPYKGGLRFHPSVNSSILKFLAFEQVFKNALTGLPLGGAKGGADFDPKGRSDAEIMRFCQAFMRELAAYIGPDNDVPAGDINVGTREIGWLFATYRAMAREFTGALTGKGDAFGGSEMRGEATGYGLIYFVEAMLAEQGRALDGMRIAISGKGNVATHAAEKAICEGGRVITLSDTSGTLVAPDGMTQDIVEWVQARKAAGDPIDTPPRGSGVSFIDGGAPWDRDIDIALPCATQNEVDADIARTLVDAGVGLIAEGANMPLTIDATRIIAEAGVLHGPGKAANAGGVAVSGLEMSQNSLRRFSTAAQVDTQLCEIMKGIHDRTAQEGRNGNHIDYARGANIAAFRKVADAVASMGAI